MTSAGFLGVLLSIGLLIPSRTQAGILAILVKFFSSPAVEVEETLPSSSAGFITSGLFASALGASRLAREESGASEALAIRHADAIVAPLNPVGTVPSSAVEPTGQIFVYTVRSGDTISSIAESFDVSVNTIRWANGISDSRSLAVGTKLVILPVTGVRHDVKKGETISSIAEHYRASIAEILQFNGFAPDEGLAVGTTLIIPNGELAEAAPLRASTTIRAGASLPVYEGFYMRPIIGGRKSRGIHGYNGVDLAASCGLPVFASAEGTVLIARPSGWNGGYGRYVVVSHANSTQTLYSHLQELSVGVGQRVRQGETVGLIGSSGNSTGCHVHFEVRGARNPF